MEEKTLNEEAKEAQPQQEQTAEQASGTATPAATANAKAGKNTGMAIVAYFLFFVPMLTGDLKDPFVKFHTNQALVLFIVDVVAWILGIVFSAVTLGLGALLMPLIWLFIFVLWIMGIINAAKGVMKPLPLIGGITILK